MDNERSKSQESVDQKTDKKQVTFEEGRKGYKPTSGGDSSNPPQGGSGVSEGGETTSPESSGDEGSSSTSESSD